MFNDIIKSSKALEMLEYNLDDQGGRNKPLSKIELHLIIQAESFLIDQMVMVEKKINSSKRCY